ncbi:hypothetical protein [Azospirillum sp. B4]|uniref:hypothetical protein n=1 Tax=Azospirillum sp. B4 TaxID=95605 RepID=UPI0005C88EA5|nr:hypothetical protein [Azospirillum sp. B4]
MRQHGVKATIVNLSEGRSFPARDSIGRPIVVPRSCFMAVAGGRPAERGMSVIGTVTDDNPAQRLTMIRVDAWEQPKRETFVATITHVVSPRSSFTYLDSGKGIASVFLPGSTPGFNSLETLPCGSRVVVTAFELAEGKWTALSVTYPASPTA